MKGFCIQRGYSGREVNAILSSAAALGVEVCWSKDALEGWVPVGSVEFGELVFGRNRKEFYPVFLLSMMHRDYSGRTGGMIYEPRFVKDGTAWKSDWESGVYPAGTVLEDRPFWIIEPVTFTQEWRYYVANGKVVTTGWYQGHDEDEPAPELGIEWPEGFSGACDFGRLDDGRLALVECHAPFACGWYGEHHKDYAEWLLEGWKHREWWFVGSESDFSLAKTGVV